MKTTFAFGILFAAAVASAAPGVSFSDPGTINNNGSYSLGWEFTVGSQDLAVTGLGFFDQDQDDLLESHGVGIYTSGGSLVVSGTVNPGDTLDGWFRYTAASATLLAGQTYQVVAANGGEAYAYNPPDFTVSPDITFNRDVYESSGTLTFATQSAGGFDGWFGANFTYEPVPEPGTMIALGAGIAAFARKRSKA